MSREQLVDDAVRELGTVMDMADLKLDEDGRLTLVFDELPVTFIYESEPVELIWLMCDLGAIDDEDPQVLQALLQFGFFTWSANRLTIALDEQGYRAIGYTAIPVVNLSASVLQQTLEIALETAEALRVKLEREEFEPDDSTPPSQPSSATHHWVPV